MLIQGAHGVNDIYCTRATFETPKYPRRPRDQYPAPDNKYIGSECSPHPHPHPPKKIRAASLISIFYWNTATGPKYSKELYYAQMWKSIVMMLLCDIFSGACGMLKSLRNHRQSQQPTRRKGRIDGGAGLVADNEKESSLLWWSLNRLQLIL